MKWLKDMFGAERTPEAPPRTLTTLRPGDLVDYALEYVPETWEVTAHTRVEYGEGPGRSRWADDWELRNGHRTLRLHRDVVAGTASWFVFQPMSLEELGSDVRDEVIARGDPPAQIFVGGVPFFRDHESFAGLFHRPGGREDGLIYWIYKGVEPGREIRVEQVGEYEVRAFRRIRAEEFQFENLLPGSLNG